MGYQPSRQGGDSAHVEPCRGPGIFLDYGFSQFATLTTFAGDTKFGTHVGHTTGTTTSEVANLVIGNLSTNTHVHGCFPSLEYNLNDNENDCQLDLDLLI